MIKGPSITAPSSQTLTTVFTARLKTHAFIALLAVCIFSIGCRETTTPASTTSPHLIKARSFIKSGQLSAARIEIMNALQKRPDDPSAFFLLSEMHEEIGSYTESLKQMEKGLSLSSNPPPAKLLKRMRLELLTEPKVDFDERLSIISTSTDIDSSEKTYLKALSLLKNRRVDEAKAALNQTLNIHPGHIDALLTLSRLSASANDLEDANEKVSQALIIDPSNEDALILNGQLALKQEKYSKAEESFTFALLEIDKLDVMTPKKYTVLSGLVLALNKLGQQAKAIQYSDILAQSRPGQLKSNYEGALTALSGKDYIKAQEELEAALKLAPSHGPSNYLLGIMKMRQGDLEAAEEHLAHALDGKYIPEKTRLALIITRLRLKQLNEAEKLIQLGLKDAPESPVYHALNGNLFILKENGAQAETSLKKALELQDNFLPALIGLVQIYEKRGDIELAKDYIQQTTEVAPNNIKVLAGFMQFSLRNKHQDWGVKHLESLQNKNPELIAPALALASYYYQQKQLRLTQKYIDAAELIDPNNPLLKSLGSNLHFVKAVEDAKKQDIESAFDHLNHAIVIQPSNPKPYILKAGLLAKDNQTDKAIAVAKELQNEEKTMLLGIELEGNIWAQQAQFSKAATAFSEVWKTVKNNKLALKIYRMKKEFSEADEAMQHIVAWTEAEPQNVSAIMAYAILQQENGRNEKAIALYERALVLKSDNPIILNNLAYLYFENDNPKALELAEKAYSIAPKSPAIADTYGWILVENKQLNKGLPILQKAAEAAPKTKEILQHYSEALTRAGKLKEAGEVMEKITQL